MKTKDVVKKFGSVREMMNQHFEGKLTERMIDEKTTL